MRIDNKTKYKTAELKKFFYECIKHSPVCPDKFAKNLTVRVNPAKYRISGRAYLGKVFHHFKKKEVLGFLITMIIPKPEGYHLKPVDKNALPAGAKASIAWVFIHEMHHCAGKHHNDMAGSYFNNPHRPEWSDIAGTSEAWAHDLPLTLETPKVKVVKTSLQKAEEKLEHCRLKVKEHTAKLNKRKTLLKKWNKKLKYYTNRMLDLSVGETACNGKDESK